MKKIICFIYIAAALTGCSKVLDIDDLNNYSPEQVWNDPGLANAYMANIYTVFGNWSVGVDVNSDELSGIAFPPDAITISNGAYSNWNYTTIRLINQAIVDAGKGSLPPLVKNQLLGQAYFLRAYTYFFMVIAHGGVPYITIPQDRYKDTLDVPRNSTKECFDLMVKDLDQAIALLPQYIPSSSGDWGKIDGNFALAFKAKLLLYKASPQFNPSNPWGNSYWNDAYTVNKKAYDSLLAQGYKLADDYANIALNERNPEVVFSVINLYPNKVANWDNGARPGSLSRGNASACPTWELVKAFPMKDGKLYNDPTGKYAVSENQLLQSYWQNRDPRFEKSIVWNAKQYPVAGTPAGYRQYTSVGIANALDNYGINPNATDKSTNNDRYTGFFILKSTKLSLTQAQVQQYDVDFIVMRFAEVMLDYAEAANETGHMAEALDMVKQIRRRAGIEPGADGNYGLVADSREHMRKAIMDERNIEFCFEGKRFWDLRRWRMLSVLDNGTKHGVESIAVLPGGADMPLSQAKQLAGSNSLTETNFRYSVLQVPQSGVKVNSLPDKYYFFPIPQSVLGRNKNLQQNIDWGGSFDPTLH